MLINIDNKWAESNKEVNIMSLISKKAIRYKAELISDDGIYPGFIENFSADDIYIQIPPTMSEADSSPGKPFKLIIIPPEGEMVNFNCRIKWSYKTPPGGLLNIVAEITDPSRYEKFYRNLN
jgi:hypothetical protein